MDQWNSFSLLLNLNTLVFVLFYIKYIALRQENYIQVIQ